ncbi:hypothetical protein C3L33_00595, partial [Rhododendron williamsianum]
MATSSPHNEMCCRRSIQTTHLIKKKYIVKYGGWFGYFSYNTFRYVGKKLPFSSALKDDRYLPDIDVCLYDDVIA